MDAKIKIDPNSAICEKGVVDRILFSKFEFARLRWIPSIINAITSRTTEISFF